MMTELEAKISTFTELQKRVVNVQDYIKEVMDFPFADPDSPVYDVWWARPEIRFLSSLEGKTEELMHLVESFLNGLNTARNSITTECEAVA